MKKSKIVFGLLPAAILALTSCGGDNIDDRRILTIEYVQGGFGDTPYEKLAEAFMVEHPDVNVKLVPNRMMDSMCGTEISNGTCSDIMIYNRAVATIRSWVINDYVLDLTDLFNEPINDKGDTILSQLDENAKKVSEFKGRYYTIPEYYNVNGFVYNSTFFDYLKQQNPALKIPETTKELKDLCYAVSQTTYQGKRRDPIVYCKSGDGYLYYADLGFEVSYNGVANMDEFFKFSDREVFNPDRNIARVKGLDGLKDIFFDSGYSYEDSWALDNKQAQNRLFTTESFMMLNGSWFENEMANTIALNPNMKMKMFAVPELSDDDNNPLHAEGYTCPEGKKKVVSAELNTNYFIPKKAHNIPDAKEFLKFMARKENCELWTKYSNSVRPMNYDYTSANPTYTDMSDFGKSVLDIATENYLYVPTSSADIALGGAAHRIYYYQFYKFLNKTNMYDVKADGYACALDDYTIAKSKWNVWLSTARDLLG